MSSAAGAVDAQPARVSAATAAIAVSETNFFINIVASNRRVNFPVVTKKLLICCDKHEYGNPNHHLWTVPFICY